MTLTLQDLCALKFLASVGGGFTAGAIARHCGCARNRSEMAIFRHLVLLKLHSAGLVDLLDHNKPNVFVITDAGRATLKKALLP